MYLNIYIYLTSNSDQIFNKTDIFKIFEIWFY